MPAARPSAPPQAGRLPWRFLAVAGACVARSAAEHAPVPRAIYTFWEGVRPQLVAHSIETWHRLAPDWAVHIIGRDNFGDYLDVRRLPRGWQALTVVMLSDLIRLEVLSSRGGVWLDSTVALVHPLTAWVPEKADRDALIGFDLDFELIQAKQVNPSGRDWVTSFYANGSLRAVSVDAGPAAGAAARIFESWGFAAPPNSRALQLWRDEFRLAVSFEGGVAEYCTQLMHDASSHEFLPPSLRQWLPYLTIHATMAKTRHLHHGMRVQTHPAEAAAFSHLDYVLAWDLVWLQHPHNYILDGTGGALFALARGRRSHPPAPGVGWMLKLRKLERAAYDCLVSYRAYADDSALAEIFSLPRVPWLWPVRLARYAAAFEARFGSTDDPFLLALFAPIRLLCGAALLVAELLEPRAVALASASALLLAAAACLLSRLRRRRHAKLL